MKSYRSQQVCWMIMGVIVVAGVFVAAKGSPEEDPPRRLVVTFEGKAEALPELEPQDFEIAIGKKKISPSKIYRPSELPTLLALVFTDNLKSDFNVHLPAVQAFIRSQPENTFVGLFYLAGNEFDVVMDFSVELDSIAEALRPPKADKNSTPHNPYNSLTRLISHMDALASARKEIVFFSDGNGLEVRGRPESNPSIQRLVSASHAAGIPVWVMYAKADVLKRSAQRRRTDGRPAGAGTSAPLAPAQGGARQSGGGSSRPTRTGPGAGVDMLGQKDGAEFLRYLSKRTGSKIYSAGKKAKDIRPFLADLTHLLSRQYVLEFNSPEGGKLKRVKLKRKIKNAKLLSPRS